MNTLVSGKRSILMPDKAVSFAFCIFRVLVKIIIKFPYNARSGWLKQRALSEIRERVDGIKLASKYICFGISTNLTQIINIPCATRTKININELIVSSKYGL